MKRIIDFLKNWTLPSAIVGGASIYYIFSMISVLDDFSSVASPVFDAVLPWFLFVILFTTFLKIDYKKLRMAKWHLWISVAQISMVLVLVGCVLYFGIKGDDLVLMECIIACVIGPCAAASSVVTAKLGGSLESMTTYTFISNVLTAVMIPLCFPLIDQQVEMAFGMAFLKIMWKVCVILVVPMGLAYVVKLLLPRLQQWVASKTDLSFYLWGCSLSIVTGITFRNIMNSHAPLSLLATIAVVSFVLCVIQFSVGRNIGRFLGSTVEGGQALGQKNTAFAIWVSSAYINPLAAVGPGCYIIWQNAINSLELYHHRKQGL
ncbi:MAG: transporter [Bacteroidales bacterium]|nr:transporter [Bacteroidales bacterium]